MKKVHKNRNRKFNQRLMESWGYSRNHLGSFKRDDERPLEAPLAEDEYKRDDDIEEGTKQGQVLDNPMVSGEEAYSAPGERGASPGFSEVPNAEDLLEEEPTEDAAEKSKKQEIEGLAAEAIAAIHKLGSAAGATIDATVDTGGPAQMSDIAEMIEKEIRKMLLKGDK